MAKKTQKLKPDTVLKNYSRDSGQFADLFNAVLFDGEAVINPDELQDADTEEHKVDKTVIMTVAGATNSRIDYNAFETGDGKMCTLFEEIAKENENKGRAEGIIETGYEFGLSDHEILDRLQKKLNISEEAAQEYIRMFGRQQA